MLSPAPTLPTRRQWLIAAAVLAGFWVAMVASIFDKSLTSDESVHAASGLAYWQRGDFRMNPENGNLPQRVIALPFLFYKAPLPPMNDPSWRMGDEWNFANKWFFHTGNRTRALILLGRGSAALLAVALGAIVWLLARRLFGEAAGYAALGLYAVCPAFLANGPLMTSDTAAALFFLGATWALWEVFGAFTLRRVLLSGVLVGCLFASKMSASLIVPVGGLLLLVRVIGGGEGRLRRLLAGLGASAGVLALAVTVLWGFYDFRFSMTSGPGTLETMPTWGELLGENPPGEVVARLGLTPGQESQLASLIPNKETWTDRDYAGLEEAKRTVLTPSQVSLLGSVLPISHRPPVPKAIGFARDHHLLPEAFLYGTLYAWHFSHWRDSFLNGEHYVFGTWIFFPYVFSVKTPLPLLAFMALGLAAILFSGPGTLSRLAATTPLWALVALYGTAAVMSPVNIGHRHILTLYPPLVILASASVGWLARRWARSVLLVLAFALVTDVGMAFPNYLAYVNGLITERTAYRHLVDSSLDWGQDLPAVSRYVQNLPADWHVLISFFGNVGPTNFGPRVQLSNWASPGGEAPDSVPVALFEAPRAGFESKLADYLNVHRAYETVAIESRPDSGTLRAILLKKPSELMLYPGAFVISATRLQQILYSPKAPWGPWNARYEARYHEEKAAVTPLIDGGTARHRLLTSGSVAERIGLLKQVQDFDALRFARLAAYLRHQEPKHVINGSVMVYVLTQEQLDQALDGPPPEMGEDIEGDLRAAGFLR